MITGNDLQRVREMNKQELIKYNESKILSSRELIKVIDEHYSDNKAMTEIVSPLLLGYISVLEKNNEFLLSIK